MRLQRLTVATNFLPFQEVRFCALFCGLLTRSQRADLLPTFFGIKRSGFVLCFAACRERTPRRRKDRCAPSRAAARDIRPLVLLLLSSKSHARFGCSLINALTTPHCRYQLFAVSRGQVLCIIFLLPCSRAGVGNTYLVVTDCVSRVVAKTAVLRPAQQRVTFARLSCSSSRQKVTLGSAVRL